MCEATPASPLLLHTTCPDCIQSLATHHEQVQRREFE